MGMKEGKYNCISFQNHGRDSVNGIGILRKNPDLLLPTGVKLRGQGDRGGLGGQRVGA
jgi:hypothetical protein